MPTSNSNWRVKYADKHKWIISKSKRPNLRFHKTPWIWDIRGSCILRLRNWAILKQSKFWIAFWQTSQSRRIKTTRDFWVACLHSTHLEVWIGICSFHFKSSPRCSASLGRNRPPGVGVAQHLHELTSNVAISTGWWGSIPTKYEAKLGWFNLSDRC